MKYLNEDQENRLNETLKRFQTPGSENQTVSVKVGTTNVYQGVPGQEPEHDRIKPEHLENLQQAVDNPRQLRGTVKVSRGEQAYRVQSGEVKDNTLQLSQSAEKVRFEPTLAELKQQNSAQTEKIALQEKELTKMREVVARQERLLKQATTPVHERLGNWFNQQKERISDRLQNFRNNIEERFSAAKQQVQSAVNQFTGVAELQQEVRQLQETLRQQSERQLRFEDLTARQQEDLFREYTRQLQQQELARARDEQNRLNERQQQRLIEDRANRLRDAYERQRSQVSRTKSPENPKDLEEVVVEPIREPFSKESNRAKEFGNEETKESSRSERENSNPFRREREGVDQYLEWYYVRQASEKMQSEAGIFPPNQGITPAGVTFYQQVGQWAREGKIDRLVESQRRKLTEAGHKLTSAHIDTIKENASKQVNREWAEEKANKLKAWQESQGVEVKVVDLEQWRKDAETVGKSKSYLEKIAQIVHSGKQQTNNLDSNIEITERAFKAMQGARQEALKVTPVQQETQQLQEPRQKPIKTQNGVAEQTATGNEEKASVRVHISELKQWQQEAQQLERSEPYLNKVGQINELAEQKASSDGFVTLKKPDYEKMQGDRQEFKWSQSQAEVQSQGQGMRV